MKPLDVIAKHKQELYKSYFLVAILSVGLSLIANAVSNYFDDYRLYVLIGGFILVLIIIIDSIIKFYKSKSFVIETNSVLVLDKKGDIIHIPFFRFHNEIEDTLNSVFAENKAFRKMWNQSFCKESECKDPNNMPIADKKKTRERPRIKIVKIDESEMKKDTKGFPLVTEAIEYIFLDWLSKKLETYFDDDIRKNLLVLNRNNIPQILLDNRIIDIISKPYEEREQFVDEIDGKTDEDIYFMNSKSGVIFSKFELILPPKSVMEKRDNSLIIKNRNFNISMSSSFTGINAVTPHKFEKTYLGKDPFTINTYKVNIKLEVNLNPLFFLFWRDWKYLRWIDIIADEFTYFFSFDEFVEKIGYNQTLTNLLVLHNMQNKKQ